MTKTVNDWGSLVLAELDGREEPGTTARLIGEATGKAVAVADDVVVSALLRLAEKLSAPAAVQKAIKDLTAASERGRAEQAALAKAKADTEASLSKAEAAHKATIERELADHKKALATAQAELEAAKKQAADLLAKAGADAEVAARLKDKAARKLAAFESVA
jgi:septal ring factor EnvC (AmiA/AmiB activator)